ncbi:hypothetical protein IDH18_00835 [Pelagibacterales bacterium SAG-MED41]|nr:hypothetical protein [Pelagibacterales bacterium SAG-MED41]
MKFKLLFFILFIFSCSPQSKTLNQKKPYSAKGFAYVYNNYDFQNKIIKGKLNNEKLQISHQNLKTGTLIKIINPRNNKSIILKNIKRIKYPDFYKILITKPIIDELELRIDLPILEILEIKKNKSFVAEKAKIYNEEKKISSNAPVTSVKISNISKDKKKKIINKPNKIFIHIASFYSLETANFLKQRIIKEVSDIDINKLNIKQVNNKETHVISGPYTTINLLKNDYIKLKNFGFEELDIYTNE